MVISKSIEKEVMHIREILLDIGEDPNREGLLDTATRVYKAHREMFKGYDLKNKPVITIFNNKKDGMEYDQLIIDTGTFYSTCEHHMQPFFGTYAFGYIPKNFILGLSKVARTIDFHASRLQTQERLVNDVVSDLKKSLEPLGIGLILKGRHLCKEMRGIRQVGGFMTTSDMRGVLRTKPAARAEFISLIK